MGSLQEAERLLSTMTRGEKAQLLQWVAREIGEGYPGIDNLEGVCGGDPCITRTRIPVWILERARRMGMSEGDLLKSYPTLRAEDLANAWAYVRVTKKRSSDRCVRMRRPRVDGAAVCR